MASLQTRRRRVVVVGDPGIGRSSLINLRISFLSRPPPDICGPSYIVPTPELGRPACAHESTSTTSEKKVVQNIRETELYFVNIPDGSQLEYRRSLYEYATVVVFCFSIGNKSSFENIKNKWYPEIRHCLPGVPMLLLGMGSDPQDYAHQSGVHGTTRWGETTTSIVSEQQARRLAKALGAEGYLECFAKQDIDSIYEFFKILTSTSLNYKNHPLDCEQCRRWKRSSRTSWFFGTVKQRLNRMRQRL